MKFSSILPLIVGLLVLSGCVTTPSKDYTEFRKSRPRSILVLPPINESADVRATYSVLTTTTRPIAESGYYVFPVAIVDHYLKENGLTVAGEMHGAPLDKLREVFGCDAVLYLVVETYGSKYQVISTSTVVAARAKLIDCRNGTVVWEGKVRVENAGQLGFVEALVTQVMNKLMDQSHLVATMATAQLLTTPQQGLLRGPRHPEAGKD